MQESHASMWGCNEQQARCLNWLEPPPPCDDMTQIQVSVLIVLLAGVLAVLLMLHVFVGMLEKRLCACMLRSLSGARASSSVWELAPS